MKKSTPRRIAVEILNRIDQNGAYAEPLLDAALSGTGLANPADRGLLTELVYGTLRMRGRLDWIIGELIPGGCGSTGNRGPEHPPDGPLPTPFHRPDPPFRRGQRGRGHRPGSRSGRLRAGECHSPERPSGKRRPSPGPIWQRTPRKRSPFSTPTLPGSSGASSPSYGVEETIAICRTNNTIPPLALRVNSLKASREQVIAALKQEGITAEATIFSPDGITLASPAAALRKSACYREGLIRVQDEASQLIARLVAPEPGERLLDLCAGSGGKTLHLAALMGNGGSITALDLQSERLRMLREEAQRLGVTIVETRRGDAAAPIESFRGTFDRVLLDAPCSGLGTLRRNPEIRWRLTPADLNRCMQLQKLLLTNAAECVRPGGRLVYSVCAVTPEENEIVIDDFLRHHRDFKSISPDTAPPGARRCSGGSSGVHPTSTARTASSAQFSSAPPE